MYQIDEFRKVVAALRAPDGCPWDKAQTHESMITCLIEETYEVIEAIHRLNETKDAQNLCEELGDLLLQVVMQSQMASEEGLFSFDNVVNDICDKMYRRHPHVFGEKKANDAKEALSMWESAKSKEPGKDKIKNQVAEVPKSFPALYRYQKMLKKAVKFYGYEIKKEEAVKEVIDNAKALNNAKDIAKEDIANVLSSILKVAYLKDINTEELLNEVCNRFAKEFD